MAIKKIIYQNKVGIVPKTVQINQVWDDDMNEIKDVVNTNADQTTQNTNDIAAIMTNPVAAMNVSAIPSLVYLLGTNVQAQLNQTESNLVGLYKLDKEDSKNLYQTGRDRVDTDTSILAIIPTDTLRITNCDNILFVNEIIIDSNSNKVGDYVKSFGTVDFITDATNTPLAVNTRGIFYVGVDRLGTPVYRTSKIYDQDVCYIARLLVENAAGVYTIISYKYMPDLANNRNNRRDRFVQQSGYLVPSGAASISFGNRAVSFYKNSINYANNKLDPNYLTIADSVNPTPMQFLFILPNVNSLAVPIATSTTIDPSVWYNSAGAAGAGGIAASNYQVYNVLLTVTGNILIQVKASTSNAPAPGVNAIFGSREDALAGLDTVVFPEILPAGDSIVLGTFYLRAGTNPNGSQLNLSSDFYFKPKVVSSSSSVVGTTIHDNLSGKNDNPAFQHVTTTDIANWNLAFAGRISSLTTTGTSGAATFVGNVLNIPIYAPQSGSANYIQNQAASAQTADLWISGNIKAGGNIIGGAIIKEGGTAAQFLKADGSLDNTAYAPSTGSGSYIQNQNTSAQPSSNFWISGIMRNPNIYIFNNEINEYITNTDTADIKLNYVGFNGSTTRFRDLHVYNGKQVSVFYANGSTGNIGISNTNPAFKLDISGADNNGIRYKGASGVQNIIGVTPTIGQIGTTTGNRLDLLVGAVERMTIATNGNVGIGTTNPLKKLEVNGTGQFLDIIEMTGTGAMGGGAIRFNTDGSPIGLIGSTFKHQGGGSTTDLSNYVYGNNAYSIWTNNVNRFVVNGNGNVGIGTTTPFTKLDVGGEIMAQVLTVGNQTLVNNNILQITSSLSVPANIQGIKAGVGVTNITMQTAGGNVGIGTTNPQSKLEVQYSTSLYDSVKSITLTHAEPTNYSGFIGLRQEGLPNVRLTFGTKNAGVDYLNTLNLSNDRVLIGTTNDNGVDKLQVNGSGYFAGKVNVVANEAVKMIGDTTYISAWDAANSIRTGYIQFNAGSASAIMNEKNTDWIIGTNGTERMRITNTGRVGIGGTPTFGKLELQNNSFGTQTISFYTNDGVANPRAFIQHITSSGSQRVNFTSTYSSTTGVANWSFESGNVLIGTTTDNGVDKLQVSGITSSNGYRFGNSGNSTVDGKVTTNSALFNIHPDGVSYAYGIATNNFGGLDIMANQASQPIRFWCGTDNSAPTERMRIAGNGNVLIGTSTDNGVGQLQVVGNITTQSNIYSNNFVGFSGGDVNIGTGTAGAANMIFHTAATPRMYIHGNGNVSIGAGDNGYKLRVGGSFYVDGGSVFKSNLAIDASISEGTIANLVNTSGTGYGVYIQGGAGARYALKVLDYAGTTVAEFSGNKTVKLTGLADGSTTRTVVALADGTLSTAASTGVQCIIIEGGWSFNNGCVVATGLAVGKTILSITSSLKCIATYHGYAVGDILSVNSTEANDSGGLSDSGICVRYRSDDPTQFTFTVNNRLDITNPWNGAVGTCGAVSDPAQADNLHFNVRHVIYYV